jgi:hypothetical protein
MMFSRISRVRHVQICISHIYHKIAIIYAVSVLHSACMHAGHIYILPSIRFSLLISLISWQYLVGFAVSPNVFELSLHFCGWVAKNK